MKPRAGSWLACGALAAFAACLNPLTDDTPSRSGSAGVAPGTDVGLSDREGEMPGGQGALPNFQGAGESPPPAEESPRPTEEPTSDSSPNPPDSGAVDAGPLRTTEAATQRNLVLDAGASGSTP